MDNSRLHTGKGYRRMKAWARVEASMLHERFSNAPRHDQIVMISALLITLSLPIGLFAPLSFLSKIWVGIFLGIWASDQLWRAYRQTTTRRLLEILCRIAVLVVLLLLLKFAGPSVLLWVLRHPSILVAAGGVCALIFLYDVWHRQYPMLQQKLGPTGMRYVYGLLGIVIPGLAFVFARTDINTLTGVPPLNFPTALATLTTFALVPATILTIALIAALLVMGYMAAMFIADIRDWIQRFSQLIRSLLGLSPAQKRAIPIDRIFVNGIGAFWVFGFCCMFLAGEVPGVNRVVRVVATYVLVQTEFSYDRTCAVSSKTRWVARLQDRKEMTASQVMIVEDHPLGDVTFSIGTCEPLDRPELKRSLTTM